MDPVAEDLVRTYLLCGGRAHSTWPRPGALDDQDAALVFYFVAIDGMIAAEEARRVAALEAKVGGR